MKKILQFVRTTLVGGLLFLVPVVALVIVLEKALAVAHQLLDPLAKHLPVESVIGLRTPLVLAIAVLVLLCFLAGLFARSALARKLNQQLEDAVLSNIPGYDLLKSMGESMLGVEAQGSYPVVLVRFDDTWQLAFQTGPMENGLVAVFVPGSPNARSGAVHFMSADRVKPAGIPLAAAMKILKHYGAGALPRGLPAASGPEQAPRIEPPAPASPRGAGEQG